MINKIDPIVEYNIGIRKFDNKFRPYLNSITEGEVSSVGEYNKLINVTGNGFIDFCETNRGIMIMANFCSDEILNNLNKLSK